MKWEIKSLDRNLKFSASARVILFARLEDLIRRAELYSKNPTEKKLHSLRISIRRVRYSMELFLICFEKKLFFNIYRQLEKLQDLSGSVRDLDVLILNVKKLSSESNYEIDELFFQKVNQDKISLELKFEQKLIKFIKSKNLREFIKILSK